MFNLVWHSVIWCFRRVLSFLLFWCVHVLFALLLVSFPLTPWRLRLGTHIRIGDNGPFTTLPDCCLQCEAKVLANQWKVIACRVQPPFLVSLATVSPCCDSASAFLRGKPMFWNLCSRIRDCVKLFCKSNTVGVHCQFNCQEISAYTQ